MSAFNCRLPNDTDAIVVVLADQIFAFMPGLPKELPSIADIIRELSAKMLNFQLKP